MKIALLLSIACAALAVTGCRTPSGAPVDSYSTSTGTVEETAPATPDPSLPMQDNVGPQTVPP
jgi:hypothetical protein